MMVDIPLYLWVSSFSPKYKEKKLNKLGPHT